MINPTPRSISPEEYLAREAQAEYKSEYRDGQVYAMAGASLNHNQITFNVAHALADRFGKRPCRVFSNEVRLHVSKSNLYTYPDVLVVCGKIEFDPRQKDTITNPVALFEVWSDSTEAYDRGQKFSMYRQVPTLQDYVMVDQKQPYIEYFRREGHFWVLETIEGMEDILTLRALDTRIPLSTIYDQVEFSPA